MARKVYDPWPIPGHQGLEPTHRVDWEAIAKKMVRESLKLTRHERVIVSADPYFGGAAMDAVRCEIQRARAIELASVLHWTPAITALRLPNGCFPDPEDDAAETRAMCEMFAVADVFILLMNDRRGRRTVSTSQSDKVVDGWPRGRSIHLHWFHDPEFKDDPAHPVNLALDRVNETAVIDLDGDWLKRAMLRLADLVRGRTVRLTDEAGTDFTFRIGRHIHLNYGDASKEHLAQFDSGRDREEELPAGSFRTIPVAGSAEGVLVYPYRVGSESAALGRGFDTTAFAKEGLRMVFRGGRIVAIETGGDQKLLDELWAKESGDKDKLGEIVIGCNPLLIPVAGSSYLPHSGFGAGVMRLIIGDNTLSGGNYKSTLHRWPTWNQGNLEVDGRMLIDRGRLIDPLRH